MKIFVTYFYRHFTVCLNSCVYTGIFKKLISNNYGLIGQFYPFFNFNPWLAVRPAYAGVVVGIRSHREFNRFNGLTTKSLYKPLKRFVCILIILYPRLKSWVNIFCFGQECFAMNCYECIIFVLFILSRRSCRC
jgi:hypothetical protein